MNLGIFTKHTTESDLLTRFTMIRESGYRSTQFNLSVMGLSTTSTKPVSKKHIDQYLDAVAKTGIEVPIVSATCNLVHPNRIKRIECIEGVLRVMEFCEAVGVGCISLCSGTRDDNDMWAFHPENASKQAWKDLVISLKDILSSSSGSSVKIGIEPEPANIIRTPLHAKRLLEEDLANDRVRIIFDAANIAGCGPQNQQKQLLDQAHCMLDRWIEIYHLKELYVDNTEQSGDLGTGRLDIPTYLSMIYLTGKPIIIHGLKDAVDCKRLVTNFNYVTNVLKWVRI
jgi:sugar phosphate isomerase/epimerase